MSLFYGNYKSSQKCRDIKIKGCQGPQGPRGYDIISI